MTHWEYVFISTTFTVVHTAAVIGSAGIRYWILPISLKTSLFNTSSNAPSALEMLQPLNKPIFWTSVSETFHLESRAALIYYYAQSITGMQPVGFFFKHNAFAPPKWSHSVLPPSTEKVVRNCRPGKKWHFQRVFPIDSKHSQLISIVTQHEAYCNSRYFPPWPVGLPPDATDRSPIPIRAN